MDELTLMKLYTVIVYDLWMCMKKDYGGLKNIKGVHYLFELRVSFVI